MKNNEKDEIDVDVLRQLEVLSSSVNEMMASRTRSVFRRYPITFTLVVLVGVVAVSEGLKGVVESIGIFKGHPWYMLITGLIILIATGKIYKKLDK